MPSPSLTRRDAADPRAVILMLHGGKQASTDVVDGSSASWRRSAAMQRAITPRAHRDGVSTWLLRYQVKGWNDVRSPSPIPDARWALEQVRAVHGDLPVVLVGHSMGARTSVQVADDDSVRGVVALAGWLPPEDAVDPLRGKAFAAAHGSRDKITSAKATRYFVRRAEQVGADASYTDMGPVGHYMLRQVRAWNEFAIGSALRMLE